MTLNRVVVCDDDERTRESFVDDINRAVGRVVAANYSAKELKDAIAGLMNRERGTLFDGADVAVIDNRLIDEWTQPDDPKVSAEQLADYVRTSSTAEVVLILNQYREIDFDLRLDGRLDSYADLNITDRCLDRTALWTEAAPEGFRPWSWPVLERTVEQMPKRRAWLMADERLDRPVLEELGLSDERVERSLSRVAADFLHPQRASAEVTFRNFVEGATRATDQKERQRIAHDDDLAAKIAAARLGKWLEATILGPQDVLVDVPHLLERFPCLVMDPQSIASWNAAISWSGVDGFKSKDVEPQLWTLHENWLSRPAYLWPLVQNDEALAADLMGCFAASDAPAEVGFCEDLSRFLPIAETREFVADLYSAFDRRRASVARTDHFSYGPANRFAR